MAATVWKGYLTFGLVSVPVRLYRAARAERVKLRQLYRPQRTEAVSRNVVSIPTANNPLTDTTGEDCMVGQRGPVWFLAGTFGGGPTTRSCSIVRSEICGLSRSPLKASPPADARRANVTAETTNSISSP